MSHNVPTAQLGRFALFAGLSDAELAPIEAVTTRRQLRDGESIFTQGDAATSLCAIVSGRIALRSTVGGRTIIVQTIERGEVLGWSSLREEATQLTTGRAVGDAEVIVVPAAALLDLVTAGGPSARLLVQRLFGVAAAHLATTQAQLHRVGGEGVITGG